MNPPQVYMCSPSNQLNHAVENHLAEHVGNNIYEI